ncbi:MAG TPA: class I SAM-dependent methyltransferase [Casimicrobiaceae bacterium]|nr:class I SAM-dependent methyltransferase [Casimicrobiaceae bacterium]
MTVAAQTNAAIAANYDAVAYDALPYPMSHPDNLAAVATMFGLDAPPVETARVLEVGCNDGSNLLPMAAALPRARFIGCDIAPLPVRAANACAAELGLANVRFVEADLAALDDGPWDYVIAHGVYSWVPPAVRDALLGLVQRQLAPGGLAFVSYNTYPGGYVRRAAWEALRWHVRDAPTRDDKLREARAFAALLAEAGPTHEAADASVRSEFARIAGEADSPLYHDTLAEPNEPVWFHDFAAHAQAHGLAYVAEALPSMMGGGGLAPRVRQFLAGQARLAREQYLDIARVRRFRQSILARADAAANVRLVPERMAALRVSASMPLLRAAADERLPAAQGPDGPVLRALLDALVAASPLALPVPALLDAARPAGTRGRSVEAILLDAWVSGFAQLHAIGPAASAEPGALPTGARVARWQAPRREAVTNLRHETIRLVDPFARALLPLCDGTRDRAALAAALADGRDPRDPALRAQVDETLGSLAKVALLERREQGMGNSE